MGVLVNSHLRIALIACSTEHLAPMHAQCVRAGHRPVAYLAPTSQNRLEPSSEAASRVAAIRAAAPPGVSVMVGNRAELTQRLVAFGHDLDLIVVFGYPLLLPRAALYAARHGGINLHSGALPRWRGPAPVLWALRSGDDTIGVTIHRMESDAYDTGPILASGSLSPPADNDFDPDGLNEQIFAALLDLLPVALEHVVRGQAGTAQAEMDAGYAGFMDTADRVLDTGRTAAEVVALVWCLRMMRWTPVLIVAGRAHTISQASLVPSAARLFRVQCADAPVWVTEPVPVPGPAINTAEPPRRSR